MEGKLVQCFDEADAVEDEGEKLARKQKIEDWLSSCEGTTDREELQKLEKLVDEFLKEMAGGEE